MQKDILLLEDDVDLAQTIEELLVQSGHSVDLVHTGNDAIDASYENSYALYVFDINVPDMNGLELLEALRNADDKTPAIFISALVDLNTIAKGFEVGAQDYIKKPFFPEELLIRINAKLQTNEIHEIFFDKIRYNPKTKELFYDEKRIPLGEVQECLCDIFLHNIGKTLDTSILMECLTHPSQSALRVALNKLKNTTHLPIKNVRGIGYVLEKS